MTKLGSILRRMSKHGHSRAKNLARAAFVAGSLYFSSCDNPILNKLRVQVKNSIEKKKYDWQIARISDSGEIRIE